MIARFAISTRIAMAAPIGQVQLVHIFVIDQRGRHLQPAAAEQAGNCEGAGGQAEHDQAAREQPHRDLRHHHAPQRREARGAECPRGGLDHRIELLQRGPHRNDHERQHHMHQRDHDRCLGIDRRALAMPSDCKASFTSPVGPSSMLHPKVRTTTETSSGPMMTSRNTERHGSHMRERM